MSKWRIIIAVFLPIVLAFIFFIPLFCWYEMSNSMKETQNKLAERVDEFSVILAQNGTEVTRHAKTLASFLTSADKVDMLTMMKKSLEELPSVEAILIAYDPDFLQSCREGKHPDFKLSNFFEGKFEGDIPESFGPSLYRRVGEPVYEELSPYHYDTRDWFLVPKYHGQGIWSAPYRPKNSPVPLYSYGQPFYHDEQFAGVVVCRILVSSLINSELLREFSNVGIPNARFFVLDLNGRVVYHSRFSSLAKFSVYSMLAEYGYTEWFKTADEIIRNIRGRLRVPSMHVVPELKIPVRDHTWYVYTTPQNEINWSIVAAFEESAVYRSLYWHLALHVLEIVLLVLGLGTVVTLLFLRAAHPIEEITRVAELVAGGNLEVQVPGRYEKRGGGTGRLVRMFNQMITKLRNQMEATVYETSRRVGIEQELSISQDLQTTFLPVNRLLLDPSRGYAICGDLIPAKFVAGDFFDFWRIDSETVGLVLADVSGKGVPAAMVMIAMNTLLRQLISKSEMPGDAVSEVNRILMLRNKKNMFVTLFLAYYYPKTGRLVYCNAGHNPPYVIRPDGTVRQFPYAENTIIGVSTDLQYESREMILEPGEYFFAYTDGVTDAANASGEQFGLDRLLEILSQSTKLPFKQFLPTLVQTLRDFQGDKQTDDITLLALKRREDISRIWTAKKDLTSTESKEETTINEVVAAMRAANWSESDCKNMYSALRKSFDYCVRCNDNDPKKRVHFSCSVSKQLIALTIGNDGDGFGPFYETSHKSERERGSQGAELLNEISGFMTSSWFNKSGTTLLAEKYR